MKKGLLIAFGAMLVLALVACGAVAAEDTKTTPVQYTVTEGYEWTAPAAINLVLNTDVNENLVVSKVKLGDGKSLKFEVKSLNGGKAVCSGDSSTYLTYTMKCGSSTITLTEDTYADLKTVTSTQNIGMTFTAAATVTGTGAGDLSDTLTFRASIIDS